MQTALSTSQNRIKAVMYRQLILYWRHLDRKFEMFFWPVVDAIMFGAIGKLSQEAGSSFGLATMLAGLVMAQIVWQSHVNIAKFFAQEMWDVNVLYVMTRPLRSKEVLTGAISVAAMVASCSVLFLSLVIAVLYGLDFGHIPIGIVLLVPVLMLMGWSTGLLAASLVVRMGQKADNFIWALFGLIGPLSGFIVPIDYLPAALRTIGLMFPMTHAYEAGREILFGHTFPTNEYAIALGGAVVLFGISLWTLARSMKRFRQQGLISRYV